MKNDIKVRLIIVMLAAVLVAAVSATAEEKMADNMQVLAEKIKADKKLLVAANMQLTEAEAKVFWPVYQHYQDELFLLRERTLKMIKNYADDYSKMTNANAKRLVDEYMAINKIQLQLRQDYLPKFRKVLPEVKVARYYQIENKINAAVMYELAGRIPLVEAAKQ
jgi:hypothetical protein